MCVSLLVFLSVAALTASYCRALTRERRRTNYVPIGDGQPATNMNPVHPQHSFSLLSSFVNAFGGTERTNSTKGEGSKEVVERERKVGPGGIDEESKGEREGERREVLSVKEQVVRANKSYPSVIQMTEHVQAYQQ